MLEPPTNKKKENRRLYCCKCKVGLGYPTSSRVKRYGSEVKLKNNYMCMKCRKSINYGQYLKEIKENGMV